MAYGMKLSKSAIHTKIQMQIGTNIKWCPSLRSRREWVPARTSVPNASAKSRSGRKKNGEESSWIPSRAKPTRELHRKKFHARTHSRQLRRLVTS